MFCNLGHPGIGEVIFPKLIGFNPGNPERPGERWRSVTGTTVHQINKIEETSREINIPLKINFSNRATLISLYNDASDLVITLQDGENVYSGYIFKLEETGNPRNNFFRYTVTFRVTEKLT